MLTSLPPLDFLTKIIKGGAAIRCYEHFVIAHLGLDLIVNQSV